MNLFVYVQCIYCHSLLSIKKPPTLICAVAWPYQLFPDVRGALVCGVAPVQLHLFSTHLCLFLSWRFSSCLQERGLSGAADNVFLFIPPTMCPVL